jgi:hypothetical protein
LRSTPFVRLMNRAIPVVWLYRQGKDGREWKQRECQKHYWNLPIKFHIITSLRIGVCRNLNVFMGIM